jgi:hypothetical protein
MQGIDPIAAMAPAVGTLRRGVQGTLRTLSPAPAMAAEDFACMPQAAARPGGPARA